MSGIRAAVVAPMPQTALVEVGGTAWVAVLLEEA
jgi:membrane protein implicated in regulation of membrane protease activity